MATTLQAIFPAPQSVEDPMGAIADEHRPPWPDRPWLFTNMVASVDGAIAVGDTSGGLGGPADKLVFKALRATADVILVGASTVRIERYGLPVADEELRHLRRSKGQPERPAMAIVTNTINFDLDLPLFSDETYRPMVLTSQAALEQLDDTSEVSERLELIPVGEDRVDFTLALQALGAKGYGKALGEGGPSINGQLAASGLIDEWNLTMSPSLVGGPSPRPATASGAGNPSEAMSLKRVWMSDDFLFCRWTRS